MGLSPDANEVDTKIGDQEGDIISWKHLWGGGGGYIGD
jgi:hypothetical protein